jgi:hypothetical protein
MFFANNPHRYRSSSTKIDSSVRPLSELIEEFGENFVAHGFTMYLNSRIRTQNSKRQTLKELREAVAKLKDEVQSFESEPTINEFTLINEKD